MRYWAGVSAALGLGGVVGFIVGWQALEFKVEAKYNESLKSMQSAYEMALRIRNDDNENADGKLAVVNSESVTLPLQTNNIELVKNGEINADYKVAEKNPYHTTVEATPLEIDIAGNAGYGISYIEEEEYEEEDGRAKEQIEVMMDDRIPIFLLAGQQIEHWDDLVGDSIVTDLVKMTPPGERQVLYVRNHRTDVDYEVMRVSP